MTRETALAALLAGLALAGCDRSAPSGPSEKHAESPTRVPAYAARYPGAQHQEGVTAESDAGPGGLVSFTTADAPEAVIGFYRSRAEAAGLQPVMEMNQGDTRAYKAQGPNGAASVQVVASPLEDGRTSVQLTWSAG
jgi:hypothetical protein